MKHAKFVVTRFVNRCGAVSWRVDGRLHGVRIRRNFKLKEEAAGEKAALEIKAEQNTSGMRSITTRLTAEQAREAEAVFQRLEGRDRPLAFYVDFALATYRDPIHDRTVAEATSEYLALRASDESQGNLSLGLELRALEAAFRGKTVSQLTPDALVAFLKRGLPSKKTYNNRRGLVGPFLKHCVLKDWIATNPVDKVPHFRGVGHRRGSAPTLSAVQCAEIMEWAETERQGALVPFIALCLFAGIRPDPYVGEISKLECKHVRLDTGVILIEPEVSKVRMKRAVAIQPNLAAWLTAYPLDRYPIMPRGFRRLRLRFRKRFNLSHDILRHTFVSMFVARFRSMGEAALQAGNSESIIRKHYLDLKSPAEAEQFFNIRPRVGNGIVAFQMSG
jgi:integrase